jgi:hypothetical protein
MWMLSFLFKSAAWVVGLVILLPLLVGEWPLILAAWILALAIYGIARPGWLLFGNWHRRPRNHSPHPRP